MRLTQHFKNFIHSNQFSGILLIFCVLCSLLMANSSMSQQIEKFFNIEIGAHLFDLKYSISDWINDGLMSIFFLLVGLEIKRELVEGELSDIRKASLPIVAAIGGMIVPAVIFTLFNHGTSYVKGWAIPMATDIAFSLAVVSLLGKKVPASLKIFLAALAIVDDLGAIVVIAIFYTNELHWSYLGYASVVLLFLILMNYSKVKNLIFYLIPGIFLWYFIHHSGIHATISGVLLALTIPTNASVVKISPLEKLEKKLHFPVNFIIMPLFAFVNTRISVNMGMTSGLIENFGLGIILGLLIGKMIGINLFSYLFIKLKISKMPEESCWKQMIGSGFLAGIGFTMSVFISLLSFKGNQEIQNEAKLAILVASIISGFVGFQMLKISSKK